MDAGEEVCRYFYTNCHSSICSARKGKGGGGGEEGNHDVHERPAPGTVRRSRLGLSGAAVTGTTTLTWIESKLSESRRAWKKPVLSDHKLDHGEGD